MEQVLDREVGKLQRYFTNHTRLSPTGRYLDLVISLRLEVENDINSSVLLVRLGANVHLLRVEVSGLSNLTCRTHQVFLAEQLTWTHTQLTAHYLLIQAVITINHNLVDACLLALIDSHLKVD